MKLTNKEVIDALNGLIAVDKVDFQAETSFVLAKNYVALENAYKPYAQEEGKIYSKYTEVGNFTEEMQAELEQKRAALQALVAPETTIEKLPAEVFRNEEVRLSMSQLLGLRFMTE